MSEEKKPGKLKRLISKPVEYIKRKTKAPGEFMKAGRAGGMIALAILSTRFIFWIVKGYLPFPAVFNIPLSLILVILTSELLCLALKIVFGGARRDKSYFFVAVSCVCANNLMATQGNGVPAALIMSIALALSCDLVGRCIWGFLKSRRFKQVFAYVVLVLSVVYIGGYSYFFRNDCFGESRVDFYNTITPPQGSYILKTGSAAGFDEYLKNGSFKVEMLTYGPEESADLVTQSYDMSGYDSVLNRNMIGKLKSYFSDHDFAQAPVKGKIWYPAGESGLPVLFFVHGNHDAGTPSYLGYEYLGEYLASNGYVVVSVDENIINDLEEGNDKRAILLLENMKALLKESAREGSKMSGLIDPDRIVIGGHSRGGEMAATAYLFNELDKYPEDGTYSFNYHFNISGIIAIAPVVDQYMPAEQAVGISDTNYLLLHGSNDQDVSSMMGEKQYNNVHFSGKTEQLYRKAAVYILGANHGQFNSLWGRYDGEGAMNGYLNTSDLIDEAQQKLIAKAYIRTFLDSVLKDDDTYVSLLSDMSPYREYLPDTVYITNYTDSDYTELCSFEDTADIAHPAEGVEISCSDISTWKIVPYKRGHGGEGEDHVLSCAFLDDTDPYIDIEFDPVDISGGCISFGIADMREDTKDLHSAFEYTVELTDAAGERVSVRSPVLVYHSLALQLYKQDVFFNEYEYKHQLQTVTVTPQMFEDSAFDFSEVVSVRISTQGRKNGRIIINEIAYKNLLN